MTILYILMQWNVLQRSGLEKCTWTSTWISLLFCERNNGQLKTDGFEIIKLNGIENCLF